MEVLNSKLIVKELTKKFGNKVILDNISFDLHEGEFLSILGPSGCGKTTLLRILIGLETKDSGEIFKDGQEISALPSSERGMGIVFQNYALFPNMNVLQNVMYALTLRKDTKEKAKEIAMKTIENVGLTDQIHKYPNQLSGGQQQRVAIARTLAMNPDVILLDEPISALDVTNREIMKAELKSLQKKFNATMLFITHDQEEAFFLSDRIMVMNEGVIEQLDTPLEIYKNPASDYVKEFVVDQLDKKYADLLRYTGRSEYAEE
ncbi:MAG: ATP-binding cassette domain-containing protein [Clostridiales bacterium]|nr:ATP-binding cassette domain-containing protein [Clostridiales bacterium]